MDGDEVLEERALIQRIRDGLRGTLATEPLPPPPPRPDAPVDDSAAGLDAELSTMAASFDIAYGPVPSYRKLIGPLLTFARRVARKLLAGPLERQATYNAANHRLARAYRRELESLRRDHQAMRRACDALEARIRQLESK
jgi:hypothetical protein